MPRRFCPAHPASARIHHDTTVDHGNEVCISHHVENRSTPGAVDAAKQHILIKSDLVNVRSTYRAHDWVDPRVRRCSRSEKLLRHHLNFGASDIV